MQTAELAILDWIQQHIRSEVLDAVVPAFTSLANHGEIWILLALLLLFRKRTRLTGLSVSAGLLADYAVCNLSLKPLIERLRPFVINPSVELLIEPPLDASFPSGHTAVSFAAVAALKTAGSPLWKPAAVLATLIALSRLYLYVHWPTDILGGVVVGWLCGALAAKLVHLGAEKFRKRK